MRILCITDQFEGANHSSIEGIFGGHLARLCDVYLVYFMKDKQHVARIEGNRIFLPYSAKRKGICANIEKFCDLSMFDVVIVRNYFPVLRQLLKDRGCYGYKLGFWNSFPHSFRRLFEALQERKAVLRKKIEYYFRKRIEAGLVSQCDFLIVMSKEFKKVFYPDIPIRYLPLPMGVDFEGLPAGHCSVEGQLTKFIYTGTVDHLRQTDLIVEAFAATAGNFILDIYTASNNPITQKIAALNDDRITLYPPLPRDELFKVMVNYDVGVGFIPENTLYRVSSPTKTLEYYSVGIPAMVNFLPEYVELFDEHTAFFCDFDKTSIQQSVWKILTMSKADVCNVGIKGKRRVFQERNYKILSENLLSFIIKDKDL